MGEVKRYHWWDIACMGSRVSGRNDPQNMLVRAADYDALAARLGAMEAALDHIGGLSRALRVGGPDQIDLEGLSEALTEAVDTAHAMLAGNTGSQAASACAQEWVDARTTP